MNDQAMKDIWMGDITFNEDLEDRIRKAAYSAKEDGFIYQGMFWLHVIRELRRYDSTLEVYNDEFLQRKCHQMCEQGVFI